MATRQSNRTEQGSQLVAYEQQWSFASNRDLLNQRRSSCGGRGNLKPGKNSV